MRVRRFLTFAVGAVGIGAWGAGLTFIAQRQTWSDPEPADAVVVLGTSSKLRDQPNPCMRSRVGKGVRLVENGLAPVLVVTGGFDPRDGLVEAESMAGLAAEMGLEPDQIVIESKATSTIENLTYSKALLDERGLGSRMLIVTEPFHLPRAVFAAGRLGFDVAGVPSESCRERGPWWLVREPAAVLWYRWKLR